MFEQMMLYLSYQVGPVLVLRLVKQDLKSWRHLFLELLQEIGRRINEITIKKANKILFVKYFNAYKLIMTKNYSIIHKKLI